MFSGKSQKDLLQIARSIIQPLSASFHKGQAGKIAVFGGCQDYTGAPFFAAHSAALAGADLSHVVCEKSAGPVIKSYSPDLMVHPCLFESSSPEAAAFAPESVWARLRGLPLAEALHDGDLAKVVDRHVMPAVMPLLDRVDVFVLGPGSGRDPLMLKTLSRVLEQIKVANKPVVVDADALFLLTLDPGVVRGYGKAVVTPNVVEFGRLCSALSVDNAGDVATAQRVSEALGGVVVVKKGEHEVIVRNGDAVECAVPGSLRRVGGQGDTLAGCIATMLVWAEHYHAGLWSRPDAPKLDGDVLAVLACYAACVLARTASRKAFDRYRRSMQTSNVHEFLGAAYTELYE